jgi:hypothetical protein
MSDNLKWLRESAARMRQMEREFLADKGDTYALMHAEDSARVAGRYESIADDMEKWRRLAWSVTSAAWSLSQWNDHNFTRADHERWRRTAVDRCLEVEKALAADDVSPSFVPWSPA